MIEVTKESYDPKEFEDEDEIRNDWMKPETKSSNEFIDESENADMSETAQDEQFDWIKDEFSSSTKSYEDEGHLTEKQKNGLSDEDEDDDDDDDEVCFL